MLYCTWLYSVGPLYWVCKVCAGDVENVLVVFCEGKKCQSEELEARKKGKEDEKEEGRSEGIHERTSDEL